MKAIYTFLLITFVMLMNFYNSNKLKSVEFKVNPNEETLGIDTILIKAICPGQMRLCSSLLWTTTMLTSDYERTGDHDKSWMYYKFNLISELDPYFYSNYIIGGVYLSIIKDEPKNAKKIYEKGLKIYPNDFSLNHNAAFNDLFELENEKDAQSKYTVAYQNTSDQKTKNHILNILSRIKSLNSNSPEDTYSILLDHYKNSKTSFNKRLLENKLYNLKAQIDTTCLNSGASGCSYYDFFGNKYELINGKFFYKKKGRP